MVTFLPPFFVSLAIAFLVTALIIHVADRLGIVHDPAKRVHPAMLHTTPTPRGGGIPIMVALLVTTLLYLPFDMKLIAIMLGAALLVVIGIADDRADVSPLLRLLFNIASAVFVVASGISISFITNPFGGIIDLTQPALSLTLFGTDLTIGLISALLAILWIVTITNVVSWSSGVDGQLAGFVPIAAATIGALSLRWSGDLTQWPVVILSFAVAGAYLGFLPWSVYPQRIMPGYSGGALAGYMLAVLAIISGAKVATAIIVLGIPVMDALFSILRRLIQGKSPFWSDAGHLHHRLLAAGWTKFQVAAFYWTVTAALGFWVLHLNSQAKLYTILMLIVLVGGFILWLTRLRHLLSQ